MKRKRYVPKRIKRSRAPGKKGCAAERRQNRRLIQLTAAGVIFVLLSLLRVFVPESVAGLAGQLRSGMRENADFKAAFSAVGEAIAGEQAVGDSLQEAYTAVFAPDEYHAERTAAVFAAGEAADQPALRLVQELTEREREEEVEVDQEEQTLSDRSLVYFSAAPANVSFSQEILGFSYTTPAKGTLTSSFGYREHPIYGKERFHYGLDIAAAPGTDICAFADGTVKAVGESSSLGNYLMLDHEGGYTTLYAHCSKVVARGGEKVNMGEKIAEMGSSGVSTGTHLHFELLEGTTYLNPIYYVEVY